VPNLGLVPEPAPTLRDFYAHLRAGKLSLQDPGGRAAFAALLRAGYSQSEASSR
jgi:hypothetical protein